MSVKKNISRLGTKPPAPAEPTLRELEVDERTQAVLKMIAALKALNGRERTQCVAAVAEFYGLTLVVEN